MGEGSRGKIRAALALAIGAGLIAFLFYRNRGDLARLLHRPPDLRWVALGLVVTAVGIYGTLVRWYLLVRAQGLRFPFGDAIRLGFVGFMFNQVIPGAVSGDLVKLGLFAREQEKLGLGMATVVVDRLLGMYGLFLLGSFAVVAFHRTLFSHRPLASAAVLVLVAAAASTAILAALLLASAVPQLRRTVAMAPVVGKTLEEMVQALSVYRGHYRALATATALACACHGCFIAALYFCARALPGELWPLSVHAVATPIGLTINAVPITSGGIGVGEAAMQEVFRLLGHDGAKAFLMMLTYRVLNWAVALVGLPYFVQSVRWRRRYDVPATGQENAQA